MLLKPNGAHLSLDPGWVDWHLPFHSSTFSWRNVALLLLFSLSLEQTSASPSYRVKKKPGECPQERITCSSKAPDLCKTDFNCDEHLKCCSFACGKKCMDPYEEPCLLPLDQGQCKNTVKHWYFNIKQRICKPFFYGGCLGNANNFPKKEDCMKACSSVVKDGQCPLFPFKNRMECSASCKSDYDCPLNEKCCESMCGFDCAMAWTDVCTLPKVPGPCNAFFVRWWYDEQKETCSSFIYGGCQGNNNNFQSESVCQAICPRRIRMGIANVCKYPINTGPCAEWTQRWFYNWKTSECESFNFGGCYGNSNNFEKKTECEETCKKPDFLIRSLPSPEPGLL
ncbi:hypothetical protein MJG53_012058 [Ovis ammon polii x Ovis aries]|uniref:WAP four-disulfide core domain protein 8 n=2 Tax=Ovis TaxID=9935 RepID=A0A836A815_SHEEP|nr:hypothetical protein JEQ12_004688 [Ovis aries]KAI4575855.1 hypothetical protein MJG53_012058 [Ovis ammon polii x Ovis aries]